MRAAPMTSDAMEQPEQRWPDRPWATRATHGLPCAPCASRCVITQWTPMSAGDLLEEPIDQHRSAFVEKLRRTPRRAPCGCPPGNACACACWNQPPQRFVPSRFAAWMILLCSFFRSSCIRPSADRAAPSSVASICARRFAASVPPCAAAAASSRPASPPRLPGGSCRRRAAG